MARLARVVVPGIPHHVTQRGNGQQRTFFSDADYGYYLKLLKAACRANGVTCLAYVLMPNHVHLILVPRDEHSLRAALAPVHRAYAGTSNARRGKTGHFWQGRFGCVAMDPEHAVAALRYVLLNPVRARLATRADAWKWSSARAYLRGVDDGLTDTQAFLSQFPDMKSLLGDDDDMDARMNDLRKAESIGRPIGAPSFLERMEHKLGRTLKAGKRGPKPEDTAGSSKKSRQELNALSPY